MMSSTFGATIGRTQVDDDEETINDEIDSHRYLRAGS